MPKIDLSKFEDNNPVNINREPIVNTIEPKVEPVAVTPTPVVETKPEPVAPTPIIITDYDKQYDPIMPAAMEQRVNKVPFTNVLSNIRNTVSDIERAGYPIRPGSSGRGYSHGTEAVRGYGQTCQADL